MMRRDFHAGYVLVLRQQFDLLARRDMQHMDDRALLAGDAQQPLRRGQRGEFVAPNRMRPSIAGNAKRFSLLEARLVLAVEGGAPARLRQNRAILRRPGRAASRSESP